MGNLTVVATIRDEAPSILQWLAFHQLVGVDRFVLALDRCEDGTGELISASRFNGMVEMVDIADIAVPNGHSSQLHFYKWAMGSCRSRNDRWAIAIDVDEYLHTPVANVTVVDVLDEFEYAGVCVSQRVFGPHEDAVPAADALVIERYARHIADNLDLTSSGMDRSNWVDPGWVKVAIKPEACFGFGNAHMPLTKTPFVHEDGIQYRAQGRMGWSNHRPMEMLRINHYFAQSQSVWDAKVERGRISGSKPYDPALYELYRGATEEDRSVANRFGTQVRELLSAS